MDAAVSAIYKLGVGAMEWAWATFGALAMSKARLPISAATTKRLTARNFRSW